MSVVLAEGISLRSGRYELQRRLGRGAAATVWLATDTLLERPVAVKVLAEGLVEDRAWLARFRREARIAARLQHPNLVSIYDFEAAGDRPYLVMAYLSGGSLQDRLDSGGAPDSERLARDVLRALGHIHAAGIVHRDVKPANVLLATDGRACLTDFGVARPEDATSITQTGQIPGTARYMAPELWRGEPADERSDLFACGVMLSQTLSDDSPAGLVALTGRLSAEDPELRPVSAVAALAMLEATPAGEPTMVDHAKAPLIAVDDEPPTEETATVAPAAVRAPTRASGTPRWMPVAALCLLTLVLGVVFANAIGGDDEPPPADSPAEREAAADVGSQNQTEQDSAPPADAESDTPASDPSGDGLALNEQGYELIQAGSYDEAVPVLEGAVAALEGAGDLNYAYALFNLGNALRLAGRPAEAIPILEQRLEIPNQQSVVAAELKQAEKDLKTQEKGAD